MRDPFTRVLRRVVAKNREPTLRGDHSHWMWVRQTGAEPAGIRDEVPSPVFDALPIPRPVQPYRVFGEPGDWRSYDSPDAAKEALGAALAGVLRALVPA
jgi:hypothetical protein